MGSHRLSIASKHGTILSLSFKTFHASHARYFKEKNQGTIQGCKR